MKVTAKNFLKDIEKVDWSKVPADFKKDAEELKAVAPFYSEGGDLKAGLDAYVSALNAKLAKAKPKAAPKKKPAAKKATPAKTKSSTKKPSQSKAEAAKAKKEFEATKAKAVAGKFASLSTKEVLAIARQVNAKRRLSAQAVDAGADHKKRLSPTPENLVRWMKEPGKFDMIGVDNYKENDPTADLKIKKEIFWNRLLKK